MKRSLPTLFFFFFLSSLDAQPLWTQETQREARYPASAYLTGFSVAKNTRNEAGDEFMNKQVEVARTELINSIYTTLQSLSSLNIENKNAQTNEVYRLKTASFSKASISGLRVEKYYDNANKTAYAFAFAKKSEVVDYNKRLISESKTRVEDLLRRAADFETAGNTQQALKSYYQALTQLRSVETAQSVLLALNTDLGQLPFRREFNDFNLKVNQGIERLQQSDAVDLNDVCYFLAYGLFLQLGSTDQPIFLYPVTFENRGFESPFSQLLQAQLEKQLVQVGQYNVRQADPGADTQAPFRIKGSYWKENEQIRILLLMENAGQEQTMAGAEATLPLHQVIREADLIPEILKKLDRLRSFRLKALNPRIEAKIGRMEERPARIQLSTEQTAIPPADIPISFRRQTDGRVLATVRTNAEGIAAGVLEGLSPSSKIQFVEAFIDLPAYLQLPADDPEYRRLLPGIPQEKARFMLKVSGPSVQLEISELDEYGNALETPVLAPKIKNMLLQKGYSLSEDFAESDLVISLQASSRTGNNIGRLYFSYVDATISVVDVVTGKEVYSNIFENVKGGGGSYHQAVLKAYQSIADSIAIDLMEALK